MKKIKYVFLITFLFALYSKAIAEDKVDCTKIKNDTLVGNLKYLMCKKNSDKIDKDGNFKKGTFNIFKKS